MLHLRVIRKRSIPTLVLAFAIWFCVPGLAFAHAELVRADPPDPCIRRATSSVGRNGQCGAPVTLTTAPSVIRLIFSEPVDPLSAGIRVRGPDGVVISDAAITASGLDLVVPFSGDQPGTYRVSWHMVAADTHPERGQYVFHLGQPSPGFTEDGRSADGSAALGLILQVIGRWLHFGGLAIGFGSIAFRMLVLRPFGLAEIPLLTERIWRLVGVAIALLVLAEPFALFGQTASLAPSEMFDPEIVRGAFESSFGRALAQRLGGAALLWVLAGQLARTNARSSWVLLAVGAGLAFASGASAHAIGTQPVWLGMAVNAIHVAAMVLWVGGLVTLVTLWHPLTAMGGGEVWHLIVMKRFGRLAVVWVGALAVTGAIMAWQHVPQPLSFVTTPYGNTLLIKSVIVAFVLGLVVVTRRVVIAYKPGFWRWEVSVLAVVLCFSALLTSLAPQA